MWSSPILLVIYCQLSASLPCRCDAARILQGKSAPESIQVRGFHSAAAQEYGAAHQCTQSQDGQQDGPPMGLQMEEKFLLPSYFIKYTSERNNTLFITITKLFD